MDDRGILWFHEEAAAKVARIVDRIRANWPCGCMLGNVDVSPVVVRYLWSKFIGRQPDTPEACVRMAETIETALSPLVEFRAESVENAETACGNWYECLKGQEHKLLLFVTSPRILDFLSPLIKSLKEEFILLTTTSIPDGFDVPLNGTVVRFRLPKAKLFRNPEMEQAMPWFYNFANAIGWFVEILRPGILICMDGCQSEYRLAAAFCKEKRIPSVCLQLGWPSYLHTGFRDLPFTYFFTWGEKFNPLWRKYNSDTQFIATGYMEEVDRKGNHQAISFFLQAPVYLNTVTYLDRMCRLIEATALRYPDRTVLVREHPEYRGKTDGLARLTQYRNVAMVNDEDLKSVYSRTKVVVSQFSSVLMEGLMYGCVPLVFNPTPGSGYSPDIEKEQLGFISKTEDEFFSKLPGCLKMSPPERLHGWFEATGAMSVENNLKTINHILHRNEAFPILSAT